MKKLSRSEFITLSIMLFGLFFGAGNLIFPPLLGNQAGDKTLISLLAFSITAVIFPVMGVIAVSKADGLQNLASRVSPLFSLVFTPLIYLAVGPGITLPRAGSVPFEMAVAPYIPSDFPILMARIIYTFTFFLIAYMLCIKPNQLLKRTGKYLTPLLIGLIILLFVGVLFVEPDVGGPILDYKKSPIAKGIVEGYNTMDAIAALNFGLVINLSLKKFNIKDDKGITNYTIKSGIVAGSILFTIYYMLSYVGKISSNIFPNAENGAVILTQTARFVFGPFTELLLAAIFTLACLTTCVGLITSGCEYFEGYFKHKISYKNWVRIWTLFSFLIANFGLNKLLSISVPILNMIYPVVMLLIFMGVSHNRMNYTHISYVVSASFAIIIPIVENLAKAGLNLNLLTSILEKMPFAQYGFSWLAPTALALSITSLISNLIKDNSNINIKVNKLVKNFKS